MMEYGRDPTKFSLPKREGIRRRVMKLGEETIEETKALFAVGLFLSSGTFIVLNVPNFPCPGFDKQDQYFSRCMDIEQLLCFSSHCCPLCD